MTISTTRIFIGLLLLVYAGPGFAALRGVAENSPRIEHIYYKIKTTKKQKSKTSAPSVTCEDGMLAKLLKVEEDLAKEYPNPLSRLPTWQFQYGPHSFDDVGAFYERASETELFTLRRIQIGHIAWNPFGNEAAARPFMILKPTLQIGQEAHWLQEQFCDTQQCSYFDFNGYEYSISLEVTLSTQPLSCKDSIIK